MKSLVIIKGVGMKRVWKWVIGIVVVLLVLGAIVAVPFAMHTAFGSQTAFGMRARVFENGYGPGGMMGRNDIDEFGNRGFGPGDEFRGGMMGRGFGFQHPMMYGSAYRYPAMFGFGFFPLGIFMLLIPLAVLGLAIYGFIALLNRRPAAAVPAEVAPLASTLSCSNCGKPAHEDWKTCPYCGNSL
jgi:hypothetical protein